VTGESGVRRACFPVVRWLALIAGLILFLSAAAQPVSVKDDREIGRAHV